MPTWSRRVLLRVGLTAAAALPAAPRAACAAAGPNATSAPTSNIGALFPLSGPQSLLGDESFRGLDLAADERNAAGGLFGRQIVLVRGDAADGAQAEAEARRLIEQGHAMLLFGSYSSAVAAGGATAATRAGASYVELDALADTLSERGFKSLFRTGPTAAAVGTLAVDAVADLLLPHWDVDPARLHPVLLHEEGADGAAIAAAQLRRCGERGFTGAESVAYSAGTLDFAPIVQRLRGVGADVLLHSAEVADVVPLHRAMQQAGWRPRMVVGAGGGYELADTAAALGAGFDGVMCAGVTPYRIADAAAPGVPAVAAAYQRKYGAPPRSGHSLVCFAGARVVLDALSRAASLDAEAVRTALLAIDIPSGVTSAGWGVKFDDKGQNTRAVPYLAQWQGGALLTVAPLDAAVAAVIQRLGG